MHLADLSYNRKMLDIVLQSEFGIAMSLLTSLKTGSLDEPVKMENRTSGNN